MPCGSPASPVCLCLSPTARTRAALFNLNEFSLAQFHPGRLGTSPSESWTTCLRRAEPCFMAFVTEDHHFLSVPTLTFNVDVKAVFFLFNLIPFNKEIYNFGAITLKFYFTAKPTNLGFILLSL